MSRGSELSGPREFPILIAAQRHDMDDRESKNELNSFLETKLALLMSYDLLTEKVQESFRKGDMENVNIRLSRREEIVQKIARLDLSLRERMIASEMEKSGTAAKFRGMVEGIHRKIRNVLEQIALKEKDLIPMMSRETEKMKRELLRMRETRSAVANYSKTGASSPRFLDARK